MVSVEGLETLCVVTAVKIAPKVMVSVVTQVRTMAEPLAVAAAEMTIVPLAAETMVAPVGMPAPEIGWFACTPVRLDTFVILVLPDVTVPVGTTTLLAVGTAERVTVPALIAVMVVEGATPVPVTPMPVANPDVLETPVIVLLPAVTTPVAVEEVVVAFAERVMVPGAVALT
jgi:hypothetical protein